ncbi:hypothetical protein [Micromonospora sp. LOL_023]|uniref:hypothetical protein n=1 Tax=Micromonospora sp. LOL_023 TaxID=3345418 RepID=UPI003A8B28E2
MRRGGGVRHRPASVGLRVGDRVWFRHAEAGEVREHVTGSHLVSGARPADSAARLRPACRGEGRAFR